MESVEELREKLRLAEAKEKARLLAISQRQNKMDDVPPAQFTSVDIPHYLIRDNHLNMFRNSTNGLSYSESRLITSSGEPIGGPPTPLYFDFGRPIASLYPGIILQREDN